MREGGGVIDLPKADNPLLFADPTGLSFGQLAPGASASQTVTLTDAGGGAGAWTATVNVQQGAGAVVVPGDRHGAGHLHRDRERGEGEPGRDRVRRPHERHEHAAHPVLVRDDRAEARLRAEDDADAARASTAARPQAARR